MCPLLHYCAFINLIYCITDNITLEYISFDPGLHSCTDELFWLGKVRVRGGVSACSVIHINKFILAVLIEKKSVFDVFWLLWQ